MFSIIMPYYKNKNVIDRSVGSVIKQTYEKWELIIVDDGSDDDIDDYLNELDDKRIKLIRQKNKGVAAARNEGIRNSKENWICFLDSDDEWLENHLEKLVEMKNKISDSDFYLTSHERWGNTKERSNERIPQSESDIFSVNDFLYYEFLYKGIIHTNSVCISKNLLDKCDGFAEGVNKGEDTDLWFRCALYSKVVITKTITTRYHRDNSFLTRKKEFNYDWIFLGRRYLLDDENITTDRKRSMELRIQEYLLSSCLHYVADGQKKVGYKILKSIKSSLLVELKRKYRITKLIYCIPSIISEKIVSRIYSEKQKKY